MDRYSDGTAGAAARCPVGRRSRSGGLSLRPRAIRYFKTDSILAGGIVLRGILRSPRNHGTVFFYIGTVPNDNHNSESALLSARPARGDGRQRAALPLARARGRAKAGRTF